MSLISPFLLLLLLSTPVPGHADIMEERREIWRQRQEQAATEKSLRETYEKKAKYVRLVQQWARTHSGLQRGGDCRVFDTGPVGSQKVWPWDAIDSAVANPNVLAITVCTIYLNDERACNVVAPLPGFREGLSAGCYDKYSNYKETK